MTLSPNLDNPNTHSVSSKNAEQAIAEQPVLQPRQSDRRPSIPLRLWTWIRLSFKDKTLWDYLNLLIVPLLLFGLAQWVTNSQKESEDRAAKTKAQQDTLNSYITSMTQFASKENLEEQGREPKLAQAATSRTILTLKQLDGSLNTVVLGFLKEQNLIAFAPDVIKRCQEQATENFKNEERQRKLSECPKEESPIQLSQAYLPEANFEGTDLSRLNLSGASLNGANLTNTVLIDTDLKGAKLTNANLTGADLTGADLTEAQLQEANLSGVRWCKTKLDGQIRNDSCSFIPKPGGRYKVVTGNDAGLRKVTGLKVRHSPDSKNPAAYVLADGATVTLTGDHVTADGLTWVRIKDEGKLGGWVPTMRLVEVKPERKLGFLSLPF